MRPLLGLFVLSEAVVLTLALDPLTMTGLGAGAAALGGAAMKYWDTLWCRRNECQDTKWIRNSITKLEGKIKIIIIIILLSWFLM